MLNIILWGIHRTAILVQHFFCLLVSTLPFKVQISDSAVNVGVPCAREHAHMHEQCMLVHPMLVSMPQLTQGQPRAEPYLGRVA